MSVTFVEPMACLAVTKLPGGSEWLWEIKLDGYRAVAVKATSSESPPGLLSASTPRQQCHDLVVVVSFLFRWHVSNSLAYTLESHTRDSALANQH